MRPPERPADLERLWESAAPLELGDLPDWLTPEDAAGYRRVGDAAGLDPDELERAGLIVDPRGVFLEDPTVGPRWSIGIYRGPDALELAPQPANPVLTREDVTDVAASYVADPFLLYASGLWHMFFEVWDWRADKGAIGLATSADGVRWRYEQIVLEESFHLSYPYVFESDGERYLVPESFQAGEIRLYRAESFPNRWALDAVLLEGEYLVDPSPARFGGLWWLFAETSSGERHDTLRLHVAERLHGPWREHPASPIVAGDASRARPAGRLLVDDGRIVRFAQDCAGDYGAAVRAFEITSLTPTSYAERPLSAEPFLAGTGEGWNAGGMHHVDVQRADGGWLAAVDGWI